MLEEGDKMDVDIIRFNSDRKGIAFDEEGKVIIIEDANEQDTRVNVEIIEVFEESAIAKILKRVKTGEVQRERKGIVDNPYDDNDDEEEDEEEDDY